MDYIMSSGDKSDCSSTGGESGWTLYLDNSFISPYNEKGNGEFYGGNCGNFSGEKRNTGEEEEEEDLSMVSDASSGPPHFPEEEAYCMIHTTNHEDGFDLHHHAAILRNGQKSLLENHVSQKKKKKQLVLDRELKASLLDDTASSPFYQMDLIPNENFTFPAHNSHASAEMVLDYSQGYSATHFQEESSACHDHVLQDQYGLFHFSQSANYLPQNQWYHGSRGWQQ